MECCSIIGTLLHPAFRCCSKGVRPNPGPHSPQAWLRDRPATLADKFSSVVLVISCSNYHESQISPSKVMLGTKALNWWMESTRTDCMRVCEGQVPQGSSLVKEPTDGDLRSAIQKKDVPGFFGVSSFPSFARQTVS